MDKKTLLARTDLPTRDVELPSGKGSVTVRGLTRGEVKECRKGDDPSEDMFVATAMVSPRLTEQEAAEWAKYAPAGDLVAVMDAIRDLSALGADAHKSRRR